MRLSRENLRDIILEAMSEISVGGPWKGDPPGANPDDDDRLDDDFSGDASSEEILDKLYDELGMDDIGPGHPGYGSPLLPEYLEWATGILDDIGAERGGSAPELEDLESDHVMETLWDIFEAARKDNNLAQAAHWEIHDYTAMDPTRDL